MGSVLVESVPNFGVPDWRPIISLRYVDECTVVICCIGVHGWMGTVIAAYAAARDCVEMKGQYTGLGMGIMCIRRRRSDKMVFVHA